MSFEFGVSFSVCFLKADSLFEGSVLRVLLNPEVCKVETPGGCRVPLRALAGDSSGPRAWGQGRWALRSQVLQGFLSLLRVTVIAVGVGPLAKGLLDVHVPLRVGQTLLVAGEEAKPFRKRKKNESRAWAVPCREFFAMPRHRAANVEGTNQLKVGKRKWGAQVKVTRESSRVILPVTVPEPGR